MTDHAALLRQIFTEGMPAMRRALDVKDEFAAFQKLASGNGLDWGQIKALMRAVAEDERKDDGCKRVDRIIEKADFANAYADMLGLGTSNMNEQNSNNTEGDITAGKVAALQARADEHLKADDWIVISPPHDPHTGELIEEPPVRSGDVGVPAEVGREGGAAACLRPAIIEEPAAPTGLAAVGGVSTSPLEVQACSDAPPSLSQEPVALAPALATVAPVEPAPSLVAAPGALISPAPEAERGLDSGFPQPASSSPAISPDLGIPPFLKRGDPECVVKAA